MTLLVHYFAVGGRGIGPTYPTRRMSAGSAAPTRQTSLAVDNSRSQTIFGSFAPSQSLRRLVRQGEVAHPPGLGTNRRTCHPHADNTRRHPRLAPAGRVRTRAQHQGRGREAPALAPRRAVGCVSGGVAGRVGWRRRSGGTCRPASVALLRAGRVQPPSWPRMGPLGSLAPLRRGCGLLARDHGRVHIWRVRGVVAGGGAPDDAQVRAVRSSVPCWPPTCSRRRGR